MDRGKIPVEADDGCGTRAETVQLRVMPVTARLAAQDGAREQRFTPKRHESRGIEIPGVQGPESHLVLKPVTRRQKPDTGWQVSGSLA
jgi:hypothetical protein